MSRRLQVLIPDKLDVAIRHAAERERSSKGEWVRHALEQVLAKGHTSHDPIERLASLEAPTADIDQMLREIELARR